MIATSAIPPTTPPAIAPTDVLLLLLESESDDEVGEDEEVEVAVDVDVDDALDVEESTTTLVGQSI